MCQMFSGVRHALKLEVWISGLLCEIRQTDVQVQAPYQIKYSLCVHGIYLGLLSQGLYSYLNSHAAV